MIKALTIKQYGDPKAVLSVDEIQKPAVKDDQVLVKVAASSINAADHFLVRGSPWYTRLALGLVKPAYPVLGADFAGTVEAIGKKVTRVQVGDQVFGDLSDFGFGAFAEYASVPEEAVALKPSKLSFLEAASIPLAGVTALQALRDHAKVQPGQSVLIHGASGGVGSYAVAIAKALNAKVTAVCSTRNVEAAKTLGADKVIDYTKEDFTKLDTKYDVILGCNGDRSLDEYADAFKPTGTYVATGGSGSQIFGVIFLGAWKSWRTKKTLTNMIAITSSSDLEYLAELAQEGKLIPFVNQSYSLHQIPQAFNDMENGKTNGKIGIRIDASK